MDSICFLISMGVVLLILLAIGGNMMNKEKADLQKINILRASYQAALIELSHTKSSESRIKALNLGRELASYSRKVRTNDSSITVFDEVALQNDLNAYGS